MKVIRHVLPVAAACAAALLSCSQDSALPERVMPDRRIHDGIASLAGQRIYFGHQSVGQNIIDGLKELAAANGIETLRFVRLDSLPQDGAGYVADSRIGENHRPFEKCAAFSDAIKKLRQHPPDIAFMKFCYSDIDRDTDPAAVFKRYRETMDSLKASSPGVLFVHVTIPLTVGTQGMNKHLNSLVGRTGNLDMGNRRRNEFNEMMRLTYRNEPLFDLAKAQSTDPEGRPATSTQEGRTYFQLFDGYSQEGGCHLNAKGARVAAQALACTLAALTRRAAR